MKRAGLSAALAGATLFTAIIVWQGLGDLGRALAELGWGLAAVVGWHMVPLVTDAFAWWLLFIRPRPRLVVVTWLRWLGESINQLLPVAQVGGDVVKARLAAQQGVAPPDRAGATVVADTTLGASMQMVFGLVGALLLIAALDEPTLALAIGLAALAMLAMLGLFIRLQRGGLFAGLIGVTGRVFGKRLSKRALVRARQLDTAIAGIYAAPPTVAAVCFWRLIGWLAGAGEVWLVLAFLGVPASLADVVMLEALGQAIRGAAFFIPGALGVQEGGFVVLAGAIGIAPAAGLTVSLAKRMRELVLGVPGLICWQWLEGRSLRRLFKFS